MDPRPTPDPFATPFFAAHTERRAIEIRDWRGEMRSYTFPTFFTYTPATMMLFTADLRRARAFLGDLPLHPVSVGRGRCLFAVACYRYGAISDGMTGYNEVALALPVSSSRVPIAPALLRKAWSSFGVFVLDLPVDSEENCHRGVTIWGLPKTMKTFRYSEDPERRTVEVLDGGELCVCVSVPRGGDRKLVSEMNRAYSRKDSALLVSKAFLDGACWQFHRLSPLAKKVELTFGRQPPYCDFAELDVGQRPLLVRSFESLSTALYWPEPHGG